MKGQNFYESVHLLRGIAAIMVLIAHHWAWYCQLPGIGWLSNLAEIRYFARVGVIVFFVISGFVLPLSLVNGYHLRCYPKFLAKRFICIESTYIASIVISLGLLILGTSFSPNGIPHAIEVKRLFAHLLYLIPFTDFDWYNGVYWTLAIEFQFYLLIAFLFPVWRVSYALSIIVAVGFSCLYFLRDVVPEIELFAHAPLFGMGMLSLSVIKSKSMAQRLAGFVIILIIATSYGLHTKAYLMAATALATVSLIVYWRPPRIKARYLGSISYSLYIIHFPIGQIIHRTAKHFLGSESHPLLYLAMLFSIALSLLIAHFLYQFIEKPSQIWSKKISY